MIKKDYFPIQDTPDWVKWDVMSKVNIKPKGFRLTYMIKYRMLVPVLVLMIVITGSYLYLNNNHEGSDRQTELYTAKTSQINDTSSDNVLQTKLNEAEIGLNDLAQHLNQDSNIVF